MRAQDMFPFGPRAMVIVSWYLGAWIGLTTRSIPQGNQDELLYRVRQMFDPEIGGLGIEGILSASSYYDWEIGAENETMGIEAFESGSLFIVESEDLTMQPIPVRIFSPREWQGLIHWGLSWHYRDDQEALALVHNTEAQVYDLEGLDEFINNRIAGLVDWEYGYPFDNPTMLAKLRSIHPQFPYDQVTLQTDRHQV